MPIRRLPDHLVNQIAAGEVVERPAAALKELVENALDARATRILIELSEGGVAHLSVADDGCGMSGDELRLAVQRHATSKLPGDDLAAIVTLGFRGEGAAFDRQRGAADAGVAAGRRSWLGADSR